MTKNEHLSNPSGSILDKTVPPNLAKEEMERYSRHLIMPEVGVQGQKKLKSTRILLIGAGGLGSPLALYLAAAGIGRIGIVDFDVVDHTNLHRQILHGTSDVGRPKLDSARETIQGVNPNVEVCPHETLLSSENALEILEPYDIIIDGTDNFPTRYLVNDACVLLGKPNVYGSIFRFEGQVSVFNYHNGPCYRCLYPEPPDPGLVPSCAEGGVLGILPGIIGTLQATEAIKIALGLGETLSGRLLLFDALEMRFRELAVDRDPDCPVCGNNPTVTELIDYRQFCGLGSESAPGEAEAQCDWDMDPISVRDLMKGGEEVFLLDVREPHEYEICHLGGHLIPLRDIPKRLDALPRNCRTVVYCRSGIRSAEIVELLRESGFDNAWNLRGGILAWADQCDPSIPKY